MEPHLKLGKRMMWYVLAIATGHVNSCQRICGMLGPSCDIVSTTTKPLGLYVSQKHIGSAINCNITLRQGDQKRLVSASPCRVLLYLLDFLAVTSVSEPNVNAPPRLPSTCRIHQQTKQPSVVLNSPCMADVSDLNDRS